LNSTGEWNVRIPGKERIEFLWIVYTRQLWELFEEIIKINEGIESILFGSLNDAINDRVGLCVTRGVGKELVFATDDENYDGSYGTVIT
jgi:hypothetical protein